MTLEELKQTISDRTGVPVSLLTCETVEENLARAKAIVTYRREHKDLCAKTTAEQFADWLGGEIEESNRQTAKNLGLQYTPSQEDPAGVALAQIEEQVRLDAGGYPKISDGGGVNVTTGDMRSKEEQFSAWLGQKMAFDPMKSSNWKPLL